MNEWVIVCAQCGNLKAQGGFDAPAILTNEEVLSLAEHNPGCVVASVSPENIHIEGHEDSENTNVMRYTIKL